MRKWLSLLIVSLCLSACNQPNTRYRHIVLQPLGKFSVTEAAHFQKWLPGSAVAQPIAIPNHCLNEKKYRYRADKLLDFLSGIYGKDTLVVGLTHSDISVTKGKHADWGIMGLARKPGSVCVISSFRPKRNGLGNQLHKVVLHEIGHTTGLPHCPVKSCLMRDAEGGIPLPEEKEFCTKCAQQIRKSGWKYSPSL